MKTKSIKTKQILSGLVTLLVLVIVFAGLLPQIGNYEEAFESLRTMNSQDVSLIAAFTLINICVYVLPYMAALPKLKYWPGFILRQTSFLISNSVPGGGAFGIGIQYAMLSSYGFNGSSASSAIMITGALNMLATISLPGIAAIGLLATGQLDNESALATLIGIMVTAVSVGSFIIIFRSKHLAEKTGDWADEKISKYAKLFKRNVSSSIKHSVMNFRESAYDTVVKRWPALVGSNYLQQLTQFSILYVCLQILEPNSITLISAFAAFALARLGSFIPLTPGGLGTVDAFMASLLVQQGVSNDIALASVLIWRFATFVPQIILGILTFLYWRIKKQKTT